MEAIPLWPALEPPNLDLIFPNSTSRSSWNTITSSASNLKYSIDQSKKVSFDRSGYKFHGRVKALADGAREGGLDF